MLSSEAHSAFILDALVATPIPDFQESINCDQQKGGNDQTHCWNIINRHKKVGRSIVQNDNK